METNITEPFLTEKNVTTKRPKLLTVLCILSFIGSGFMAVAFLLLSVTAGALASVLSSIPGLVETLGGGMAFIIISFVLSAISFFGVLQMWKLKKSGFLIYSASQMIFFIIPLLMISAYEFSVFGLVITLSFIVLYGINLKHLS